MPVKQGSGIRKSGRVFGQGKKTAKTVRAGLYARVSTHDQQTLPMQSRAMRDYAARRGWIIAMQVKEVGSGAPNGNYGRSCWKLRGGGRSMLCWCGGWIAGEDRSPTCLQHFRSWSISASVSCR